ncbi:MAG: hypothetical protein R2873_30425 [Caldilineaceae bacterium]
MSLIEYTVETARWTEVAVVSDDGFGVRLFREEVEALPATCPRCWLHHRRRTADPRGGADALDRTNETEGALRQVKWIAAINIV